MLLQRWPVVAWLLCSADRPSHDTWLGQQCTCVIEASEIGGDMSAVSADCCMMHSCP